MSSGATIDGGADRQRPSLFASALKTAKATLDPLGLLSPGVLIDP